MTHLTDFGGADPTNVVGRRLLARIVDSGLQIIVTGIALSISGSGFADVTAVSGTGVVSGLGVRPLAVAYAVGLTFSLVNGVVLVAARGYTLGKLAVGLRCVDALGRAPGLGAAVVRAAVMFAFELFGFIGQGLLLISVLATKGHRSVADYFAKTFVIDSSYEGRLIVLGDHGAVAGPQSMTREEAERLGYDLEVGSGLERTAGVAIAHEPEPPAPPAGVHATPSYDPSIRTHVVFDSGSGQWLKYRSSTREWVPM